MLIYLAVTIFRMHLDAAKVSQVYEMSWHANQHCETVYEPWTGSRVRVDLLMHCSLAVPNNSSVF